MAGDGNYGGNGSIYWQMRHAGPKGRAGQTRHRVERSRGCVTGRDPKPVRANGATKFRVTLRFSTSPVGSYSQASKTAPTFLSEQRLRKRMIVSQLDRIAREAQR